VETLRTVGAIIVLIIVVVVVHEFGHFIVAKRSGIQVDEFAVGFGPKLLWKRVGETVYAIRAIPAGGFVRLAGMMDLPIEADPGPRAFFRASIPRRTATILAGGVFNLVFAGLIFSLLNIPQHTSSIPSSSPLAAAGLRDGDAVVSVDGRQVDRSDAGSITNALHDATDGTQGRPATVVYRTPSGDLRTVTVRPYLALISEDRSNKLPESQSAVVDTIDGKPVGSGNPAALLGNGASVKVTGHELGHPDQTFSGTVSDVTTGAGELGRIQAQWRFGFDPGWDGNSLPYALGRGFTEVPSEIAGTFTGLYQIITTPNSGGVSGNLSGPVGIIRTTGQAAGLGWSDFINWIGILSLNLGLFNLLPIPFLDGGRFVFIMLEAVRRRRVDPRREAAIHYVGLMLILALVFYVTLTGDIGSRS
jgi:regulator of sigma E protease